MLASLLFTIDSACKNDLANFTSDATAVHSTVYGRLK